MPTPTCPFPPGALVAAYLRDSGGEEQDLSTAQQLAAIQAYCADHHLTLSRVFTDAAAPGSSTAGRDQFRALFAHFRQPRVPEAGVIIWKYSRWARDIDDAQYYRADLRRRGYLLHSLNDTIPTGPEGRIVEAAIDFANERFLDDLSIDVKRGLAHYVQTYRALPGNPPIGFIRVPVTLPPRRDGSPHIGHRWEPDPALIDRVRLAFQMRADGAAYRAIHQATHLAGSNNTYTTLFRNRLYIGILDYSDFTIPDYCAPIVPRPIWDAVQSRVKPRAAGKPNDPDHPRRLASAFALSGLLRCARCGNLMTGKTVQPARERPAFAYYLCQRGAQGNGCSAHRIPRELIERAVLTAVLEHILKPESLAAAQAELVAQVNLAAASAQTRLAALSKSLAAVNRKITNTTDAIAATGSRALRDKLTELEQERAALENHILNAKTAAPAVPLSPALLQQNAAALADLLPRQSPAEQRQFYRSIISRLVAERDAREVIIYLDFFTPPTG